MNVSSADFKRLRMSTRDFVGQIIVTNSNENLFSIPHHSSKFCGMLVDGFSI